MRRRGAGQEQKREGERRGGKGRGERGRRTG